MQPPKHVNSAQHHEVAEHFVAVMHVDMRLQSCTPGVMQKQDAGHAVQHAYVVPAGHDQPDCGIQCCKRQYSYTAAADGNADKLFPLQNDK